MDKNRLFLPFIVLVMVLCVLQPSLSAQTVEIGRECKTLYFVNVIMIQNSSFSSKLYLEKPTNVSLQNFYQKAVLIARKGVEVDGSFTIKSNSSFFGYHVYRVRICYPSPNTMIEIFRAVLNTPTIYKGYEMPKNMSSYIGRPHRIVLEVVKPEFEKWILSRYGISTKDMSSIGLAATAALFIYRYFIKYEGSPYPRTIEEVVKSRTGDCDDMSRVLVELLWSYRIPAMIIYGYVIIPMERPFRVDIEGFRYVFINLGPHAFVLAYVPPFGWLSLDFLAFSLIPYPFIVEGYSQETEVNKTAVEEFKEVHRKIRGAQLFAALDEKEFRSVVKGFVDRQLALDSYLMTLIRLAGSTPPYADMLLPRVVTKTSLVYTISTVFKTITVRKTVTVTSTTTFTIIETIARTHFVTHTTTSVVIVIKRGTYLPMLTLLPFVGVVARSFRRKR